MLQHKTLCVLGLGYIGLPTASMFAAHGCSVTGVDVNPSVVEIINAGDIHIQEPGLRTVVHAAVRSGGMTASTTPVKADAYIIAVPTPCLGDPDRERRCDASYIVSAMQSILPLIEEGALVILESTSPPGTTANLIEKPLRDAGFIPGQTVFIAHCPERVLPGHILRELTQNDRVVGGITPKCSQAAAELYERFVEGTIHRTSATTAELVKLMENTYRDVNIALANELADICQHLQVDVQKVIALANCHPRVHLHSPGPGVGGHCLPLDPWFVIESAPEQAHLIRQARLLNYAVPRVLSARILADHENLETPAVALFGVAYKGNVDDARESPAEDFIRHLSEASVDLRCYDPHVKHFSHELSGLEDAVRGADAIVVTTPHNEFRYLDPSELRKLMRTARLYDFCNTLDHAKWRAAGFEVSGR